MEKYSIGYVYYKGRSVCETDDLLMKQLKKKVNVIPIILEKQFDYDGILAKAKECDVILNNAAAEPSTLEAIELTKTLEEIGKKVINSSHSFYYQEDKWMFYLKCLENKLPTPKTHIIPREGHNSSIIKKYLENGPLILKAVFSSGGLCVEKADNYGIFKKKLSKIISKTPDSPIIAQEYIPSNNRSYRITLVGGHVIQAIEKSGRSWKQTGDKKTEHYRKIRISGNLRKLCEKASKAFGMELCGLDLILNDNRWYIIEANSCPGLEFIKSDEKRIAKLITDYLYDACKKHHRIFLQYSL